MTLVCEGISSLLVFMVVGTGIMIVAFDVVVVVAVVAV